MNGKWTKVINGLSLLIDEARADWIMEAERLETAKARIELFEREQRHMCVAPGCRNPVVGQFIFAHCEKHLKRYESRWLEEGIESLPQAFRTKVDATHPIVKSAQETLASRDEELAMENATKIQEARAAARDLVDRAESCEAERRAYLPAELRERIETSRARANGRLW